MNEDVAEKLKQQLEAGKSYQDASAALQAEGFSHMQVVDAKILLDSQGATKPEAGEINIGDNPELAAALLQVNQAAAKHANQPASNPQGGPIIGQHLKPRTLIVIVVTLVTIGILFWMTGHVLK